MTDAKLDTEIYATARKLVRLLAEARQRDLVLSSDSKTTLNVVIARAEGMP